MGDRVNAGRRIEQDVLLGAWSQGTELDPDAYADIVEGWAGAFGVLYLALCGTDPGPSYPAWLASGFRRPRSRSGTASATTRTPSPPISLRGA